MSIFGRIREWESNDGPASLRACGLAEGCRALDFGFGRGHYAVAAANAAGSPGGVLAMDCDLQAVEAFRNRIATEGIKNIDIIHSDGGTKINLNDASMDFVMLYDLLHFHGIDKQALISEVHKILSEGGILSVLPFHLDSNDINGLVMGIERTGFSKPVLFPKDGLHFGALYRAYEVNNTVDFDSVERDTYYNFTKL